MKLKQAVFLLALILLTPYLCLADNLAATAPSTKLPDAPAAPVKCEVPAKDPAAWNKSLGFGFSLTDGNSSTTAMNFAGAINRDFENNIWDFKSTYLFEDSDNTDDKGNSGRTTKTNDLRASASYKRIFDDIYFGGFGGSFRHDEVADIQHREVLNPTLGAFLIKDDSTKFSLEAGPSYIFEKVGDEDDNYLAPRVADIFEWKLSETGRLFQSAEVLFDVNDSENYIVNAEAGAESALTSLLSLVLVVRDSYDNQVPEGIETNDLAFITSIKVNL